MKIGFWTDKKRPPFSEEWKHKLGNSMRGKKHNPETIERIRQSNIGKNKGKIKSPETIQKLKDSWVKKIASGVTPNLEGLKLGWVWSKGKKRSEETRKKISDWHKGKPTWSTGKKRPEITGPKNKMWKGGLSNEGSKIRRSLEYKAFRLSVFERDKFTCQMPGCGIVGGQLNCHHIEKFSKNIELRLATDNGITLCLGCHRQIWKKEDNYIELFKNINNLKKDD